MKRPESKQAL